MFAIIGTNLTNENFSRTVLFENNGTATINATNILFVGNIAETESNSLSFFYNTNNLDLKSEFFIMENNEFYSVNGSISLFYNESNFKLDANFISISRNIAKSKTKSTAIFYNKIGSATFGTADTETLIISENNVRSEHYFATFLFVNNDTLNLNGKSIIITNNTISPAIILENNNKVEHLYSSVFYNGGVLETKMNINLYGTNPSFVLINNQATTGRVGIYNTGVVDIILVNNSQLNFINNSNSKALIKLEHGIVSLYTDNSAKYCTDSQKINSTITFKNGEYEKDGRKIAYNGSIELDIGPNMMETNTLNIETKTFFLLAANNEGVMSRLVGKGGTNDDINTLPKLNITKDGKLIISAGLKNRKNIEINKPYTIISGFVITEDVKNRITLHKNLDAVINYIDDENNSAIKTITVLFNSFDFKVEEEIRNNHNYNAIYDMFREDYEKDYNRGNEIIEKIAQFFFNDPDDNNSTEDKISVIKDILPTEPSDVVAITSLLILRPINNAITNRLTTINSILRTDNNIMAYNDNEIIINSNSRSASGLWIDVNYNFSHNYNNKSNINSMSIIAGGEYSYGTRNDLLGLALGYTSGNSDDYKGGTMALYSNVSMDRKGINFMSFIINVGFLNIKEVRNSNRANVAITYNYDTSVTALTGIFGHNIKLTNGDILTPKIVIEYSSTKREMPYDNKLSNIDLKMSELSIEMLTPAIGVDYQTFINKTKTLTFRTSINFKYDINLTKETDVDISFPEDYYYTFIGDYHYISGASKKTLKYDSDSINNFSIELSLALDYYNPAKPNLKFSVNGYMGFSTNKYINMGINLEGRWRVR